MLRQIGEKKFLRVKKRQVIIPLFCISKSYKNSYIGQMEGEETKSQIAGTMIWFSKVPFNICCGTRVARSTCKKHLARADMVGYPIVGLITQRFVSPALCRVHTTLKAVQACSWPSLLAVSVDDISAFCRGFNLQGTVHARLMYYTFILIQ